MESINNSKTRIEKNEKGCTFDLRGMSEKERSDLYHYTISDILLTENSNADYIFLEAEGNPETEYDVFHIRQSLEELKDNEMAVKCEIKVQKDGFSLDSKTTRLEGGMSWDCEVLEQNGGEAYSSKITKQIDGSAYDCDIIEQNGGRSNSCKIKELNEGNATGHKIIAKNGVQVYNCGIPVEGTEEILSCTIEKQNGGIAEGCNIIEQNGGESLNCKIGEDHIVLKIEKKTANKIIALLKKRYNP